MKTSGRFFLFALFCVSSALARGCSSLDGPWCLEINGMDREVLSRFKPRHQSLLEAISPKAAPKSLNTKVFEPSPTKPKITVQPNPKDIDKRLGKEVKVDAAKKSSNEELVEGIFMLRGTYTEAENKMELFPIDWVKQPAGSWSMVTLKGGFQGSELVLSLVDEDDGSAIEPCTALTLRLTTATQGLSGVWEGQYTCYARQTKAVVKFVATPSKTSQTHIEAEFTFITAKVVESKAEEVDLADILEDEELRKLLQMLADDPSLYEALLKGEIEIDGFPVEVVSDEYGDDYYKPKQ